MKFLLQQTFFARLRVPSGQRGNLRRLILLDIVDAKFQKVKILQIEFITMSFTSCSVNKSQSMISNTYPSFFDAFFKFPNVFLLLSKCALNRQTTTTPQI